jgi:DNA-binding transcriptional ArsR family regulator
VNELAEPFAMTQPAISKHLKVLERAGLISRGRDAQRRPRRLEARPLAEATEWLERYRRYWESTFQRLDVLLEKLKAKEKKSAHRKHTFDLAAGSSARAAKLTRPRIKISTSNKRRGKQS